MCLSRAMTAPRVLPILAGMLQRRALSAMVLASLLGLAAQLLFFHEPLGLNALLVTVLFLGAAWVLRDPALPLRGRDAWLPASAFVFAAFCAVRADAPLLAFDVVATIGCVAATVAVWSGAPVSALRVPGLIAEGWSLAERAILGAVDVLVPAWPRLRIAPRRFARGSRYVGGIGLAAPFVVIFAVLFSSADAVFARSLENVLDLKRIADVMREMPGRLVIGLAFAWPAAGALAALWRVPRDHLTSRARSLLAAETATVTLALVAALFAIFVTLQLAYLFGGRDTLEAAAITYSAYARRGFFELIASVALVGALLFGLEIAVRSRERTYVAAALTLLALTAVVLASASYRLYLYQRAYGWTELRFYATCAIAFLALALAIIAWSVGRGRMSYALQPLAMAALLVTLTANAMGPAAFVARANVARIVDPSGLPADALRTFDADHLVTLGGGAIVELVDAFPRLPLSQRLYVDILLRIELSWRDEDRAPDWQGWNFERERERLALVRARDELLR
jgi:Na+-transporting NADH:ubiquinone oxidoreductase subunit NqrE